ncbi:centrosomal protein of 104 kDa-like [Pollicipes pollicipes]|uniref:centrosomal protein of 104 kDa-like n=1 Tax=Pollicipes pollicipes TaxID=41117 RepID=UPI0018855204|nr:centrosomal protein of 104 kDa-like [Pollicipes pollicipes]
MPATKLAYHVCNTTSEDHEHPAKELDVQAPHSRGWRSRQFCIYPQEIAFQLGLRTHISRIQVLLHQLLVPERIDFFVGDVERGRDETYANARFAKLGYVALAAADESGGKARELKSVAVDCEGLFIKLVIHRNHMTKANKYNQVSIVGVNFLGEEKEANNNTVAPARSGSAPLTQDGISNYDDLAFNMYTDYDSAKYMRKLEARKATAAKNERFDYAQNCKEAVDLLQKAGLRLGKYEIEKRMAIEEENYDRAKQKKDHIEEYKEAVMEALKVQQLMEEDGTNSNNDILMRLELPPPPAPVPPRRAFTPTGPGAAAWSPPPPRRRPKPLNKYECKRLAAEAGIINGEDESPKSSNLSDEDRKMASLPIEVFGEPLVGNFYAKSFTQKEEGLRGLMAALKADDGSVKADKMTRAATMLLQRVLKDKVYTVTQLATETLDFLTGPYAAQHKTSRRELSSTIEATLPELVLKTGDNATRVQTLAVESLLRLGSAAHARQIPAVASALTVPLQGAVQTRVALAKLDTVERLVTKHGVSAEGDSPMSVKNLALFALSAVEHPNDGVRAAGTRLMVLIYPENRKLVRKLLPADDKKTRKSLTYRTLFAELAKLDGKSLSAMIAEADAEDEDDEDDRTCVFCGDINDKYVTDEGIEYHFWKQCPMLLRCRNCKQVVEIPSYTEHLLSECKDHANYQCCERCQEAIPRHEFDEHVRSYICMPARSGPAGNHCPLCHRNTAPYDSGWQAHLITECPANSRNRHLTSAIRPKPATKGPKSAAKKPKPAIKDPKPAAEGPKQPATKRSKPAAKGPKPAIKDPKPAAKGPKQPATKREPKPAIKGPKPTAKGSKPPAERPKSATEGSKSATKGPKPAARGQKPTIKGSKSAAKGPKPVTKGPKPTVRVPGPDAKGPKLAAKEPESVAKRPKPTIKGSKPTAKGPEPVAKRPK